MPARTALLVDDDPATGDSVRALLPWRDVKLASTANADEAIDCLKKHDYCGLVLNLDMNAGRALNILNHLSDAGVKLPIVVIASKFPDSLRELAVVDNIKLVMARPFDASLLAGMILGLCGIER
jgi:FixJ family two-component response regulator